MKLKIAMLKISENFRFKFVFKWLLGIIFMTACVRLWGELYIEYIL